MKGNTQTHTHTHTHTHTQTHTETATERCSLEIAIPKFSKYKERLLMILAKALVFHCTFLVSNKNIFTHIVTLACIPSYNCMTILTL